MTDEEMQEKINQEIGNWRKENKNEPLIIEFDEGEKFVFLKVA